MIAKTMKTLDELHYQMIHFFHKGLYFMLIIFKGFLSNTSRACFGFIFLRFDTFASPYSVNASTGMEFFY